MSVKKLKYTPKFKKEVCDYAKKENIINAAKTFCITRKTVSKWLKVYKKSDFSGLSERKQRSDSGSGEINTAKAAAILKHKNKYPSATYDDIKQKFLLNCSSSLISRKLNQVKSSLKGQKNKERIFFIGYRVIRQIHENKNKKVKFRLELYDDHSGMFYISYSDAINRHNFSSFVRDVKICLKSDGFAGEVNRIKTNVKYLANVLCNIAVKYDSKSKNKFSKLKPKAGYDIPDQIATKVRFLCIKKDVSDKGGNLFIKEIKTNALMQIFVDSISKFGDEYYRLYDLDKALTSYKNLFDLTLKNEKNKKYMVRSLYKQADIYYLTDKYTTSSEILNNLLMMRGKCCEDYNEGHIYYYLGKISELENNVKESEKYFTKSVTVFNSSGREFYFDYLRSEINRNIVSGKYSTALDFANKFVKNAGKAELKYLLCSALDLRGRINFHLKKYDRALKDYNFQMEIAKEHDLTGEEIKSISNILSVYILDAGADSKKIDILVKRAEFLSNYISDEFNINHIYQSLGNFYFYKNDFIKAIKYLDKAGKFYITKKTGRHYTVCRHYMGLSYFSLGNYTEAAYIFIEVAGNKLCDYEFKIHSTNLAGRALLAINKIPDALKYFKLSVKYSNQAGNGHMEADALKCIGKLYRSNANNKKSSAYFTRALCFFKKLYRTGRNEHTLDNIKECRENLQELNYPK